MSKLEKVILYFSLAFVSLLLCAIVQSAPVVTPTYEIVYVTSSKYSHYYTNYFTLKKTDGKADSLLFFDEDQRRFREISGFFRIQTTDKTYRTKFIRGGD